MRITAHRMLELAGQATSKAQSDVAELTGQLTSGKRVERPSDDPVAWSHARRLEQRQTISVGRGEGADLARDQLGLTEQALGTIGGLVAEAKQYAVQAASGSLGATDRRALSATVSGLFDAARAAANTRGIGGEYLLAGSLSGVEPFNAAGVYAGDASTRTIETAEGGTSVATVPGSVLTAAAGVDVLPALGRLVVALGANDLRGIQSAIDELSTAHDQVSKARSTVGSLTVILADAAAARGQLEDTLQARVAALTEIDVVHAAGELAQRTRALEVAQTVNGRLAQLLGQH